MFCKKVVFKDFVKLTGKNLLVFLFLQACNVIKKETPSQVFSCEFGEIFKNIFLIEHLRWLLLPNLKPLDSLRQLCKWISKLVTVYFISTFLILVGIFMFIFGEHKLSFTSRKPCSWGDMTFLIFHVTSQLKCHVTFWVEHPHPDSAPYQVLGFMNLVNVDIKRFWFVTWPHDWYVTWPWAWGPLILSPQPAKFGTHRPCESGDITFFICHVATWSMCHVTLYVRCSHLNHHLAKFGVHMPCGSGDITFFICHVTTISECHVTWWVGFTHPKPPPC